LTNYLPKEAFNSLKVAQDQYLKKETQPMFPSKLLSTGRFNSSTPSAPPRMVPTRSHITSTYNGMPSVPGMPSKMGAQNKLNFNSLVGESRNIAYK
jgi:hypothetical protein